MPGQGALALLQETLMPVVGNLDVAEVSHAGTAARCRGAAEVWHGVPSLLRETLMSVAANVDVADTHVHATAALANVDVRRSRC